jgi:hypothetical protein
MPLEPHLTDQSSQPIDTQHCSLDRIFDLIVAGEWVPYFEGQAVRWTLIRASGDLQ